MRIPFTLWVCCAVLSSCVLMPAAIHTPFTTATLEPIHSSQGDMYRVAGASLTAASTRMPQLAAARLMDRANDRQAADLTSAEGRDPGDKWAFWLPKDNFPSGVLYLLPRPPADGEWEILPTSGADVDAAFEAPESRGFISPRSWFPDAAIAAEAVRGALDAVPEPAPIFLFVTGLLLLTFLRFAWHPRR